MNALCSTYAVEASEKGGCERSSPYCSCSSLAVNDERDILVFTRPAARQVLESKTADIRCHVATVAPSVHAEAMSHAMLSIPMLLLLIVITFMLLLLLLLLILMLFMQLCNQLVLSLLMMLAPNTDLVYTDTVSILLLSLVIT